MKEKNMYKEVNLDERTFVSNGSTRHKKRKFVDYDDILKETKESVSDLIIENKNTLGNEDIKIRREDIKSRIRDNKRNQLMELHAISLTELFYRALPLDEDYKSTNSKQIKLNAIEYYKTLMENKVFDLTECDNSIINLIESMSNEVIVEPTNENVKKMIDTLVYESDEAIKIVNTKVKAAITQEYNFNNYKDQYLQENLEHMSNEDSRQFKKYLKLKKNVSLMEAIGRIAIKREILENGKTKIDGDKIFGEVVEYYTMLETLHTFKLINTDIDSITENLRNTKIELDGVNILDEKANMDVFYMRSNQYKDNGITHGGIRELEISYQKEKRLVKTEKDKERLMDDLYRLKYALEYSMTDENLYRIDADTKLTAVARTATIGMRHLGSNSKEQRNKKFRDDIYDTTIIAANTIGNELQKRTLVERKPYAKKAIKVIDKLIKDLEKLKIEIN